MLKILHVIFYHVCNYLLLLTALSSCSLFIDYEALDCDYELDSACEDPSKGQVYGQILLPTAAANSLPTASALTSISFTQKIEKSAEAEYFSELESDSIRKYIREEKEKSLYLGEYIIAKESGFSAAKFDESLKTIFPEHVFDKVLCSNNFFCLLRIKKSDTNKKNTSDTLTYKSHQKILEQLQALKSTRLKYVESNIKFHMNKIPNDEFYEFQWNLDILRMPVVWEVTTGKQDIVTAVLDTGVVSQHPDLKGRLLIGADLISDVWTANDGDGLDMDAEDVGDESCGADCHSFHGTHVAGIIGAKSNNVTHISGVSWQGWILPVRILGKDGGSLFDIAQGILWAVGEEIDGLDTNINPADVLNLSLGAKGESKAIDEAISFAVAKGSIVVVASGNEGDDAANYTPANSPAAIVVGAIAPKKSIYWDYPRAPYSNYGKNVDIVAPGGDIRYDQNSDGHPDGILSSHGKYVNIFQGTSMAAPQVAGIAALVKGLSPLISQHDFLNLLRETARQEIDCPLGCGAGLVDAAKVLLSLDPRAAEAWPIFSVNRIRLGLGETEAKLKIENIGLKDATVTLKVSGDNLEKITFSGDFMDFQASETRKIIIKAEAVSALKIKIKRATQGNSEKVNDTGEVRIEMLIEANEEMPKQILPKQILRVQWDDTFLMHQHKVLVAALKKENDFFSVERAVLVTSVDDYRFKLYNLSPGEYKIIALYDDDNDGEYEAGEGGGILGGIENPTLLKVSGRSESKNNDFYVIPSFQP